MLPLLLLLLLLQNLTRPDEEEIERTAKETLEALNKRVNSKLATQNPSTLPEQPGAPTYIKYTPSQQGAAYASGAKQRIIKMQDMPVDPLEPPKFRHTKVPRGTGSPPVPVMHSPPRPVTAEDHANWKIPPCISNWKNAKGYTIPLDKRLAADGRGLQVRRGAAVYTLAVECCGSCGVSTCSDGLHAVSAVRMVQDQLGSVTPLAAVHIAMPLRGKESAGLWSIAAPHTLPPTFAWCCSLTRS
jgi:hypothetical protein